ncbi:MAG: AraC family transcriptional regulator [Clostridia bacterium]
MNSLFNEKNKHFCVASYVSIPTSEKHILIDCPNELCFCLVTKGDGELQIHENGRFKNFEKVKKNELIVAENFNGRIAFSSTSSYVVMIKFSFNENREEYFEKPDSLTLGNGDILNTKALIQHIDLSAILPHIRLLLNDLDAFKALVFSSNEHITNSLNRLVDLLNSNRIKFHDHFFTEVLINEILLNTEEKYRELIGGNQHVSKILSFIDANYKEPLSLLDIANGVNLNISYMQKIFKDKMGNTVYDYLAQYRLNLAISLMKSTTLPLVDIAIESGFSNRQTFYNVFKSYMGYSPKTFRKFLSVTNTQSSAD